MTSVNDTPWSLETLRIYLETRLEALNSLTSQRFEDQDKAVAAALLSADRAVSAALAAAKEAVAKAEEASEKRFDAMNEFRAQLADQTATFIPRTEAEQRIATNADKIDVLAARIDKTEGRTTGISSSWSVMIAAIGAIATVITVVVILVATRG